MNIRQPDRQLSSPMQNSISNAPEIVSSGLVFQEKIQQILMPDSFITQVKGIQREQDFRIIILNGQKRTNFSVIRGFIQYRGRNLIVLNLTAFSGDKIHFEAIPVPA